MKRKLREGRKAARWHLYNLIPTAEEFGPRIGQDYEEKAIAFEQADGNPELFRLLYEEREATFVFEMEGLKAAYHWND